MTVPPTTITVGYERKLSDGNYGSEGLSVMLTMPVEDDDDPPADVASMYAKLLRRLVLSELGKSRAPRVARMAAEELEPDIAKVRDRLDAITALTAETYDVVDDSDEREDLPF